MKPTRISEVITKLLATRWPVFIWGPPGVGKSSIVASIAETQGLELLDVRASLLDPTDIRGIPSIENGRAIWTPPSFLPQDPKSKGILFFDELNAAPPLVQASLYQLTLDRRIGEYSLPDGWRILGAGNRAEDASVVFRMPAALSNRFVHVDFEVNVDDWSEWAAANKIHPNVIGFIRFRREMLFEMSNFERAFPTPRSWEMVSDALKTFGDYKDIEDVIVGIVGEGASIEFLAFNQTALSEEMVLKIIDDPQKADIPEDLGTIYALVSYVASRSDDEKVMVAAGHLLSRLNPELGVFLARDVLVANPKFMTNAGYRHFIKEHASLLV
jgi:hypothetical protein